MNVEFCSRSVLEAFIEEVLTQNSKLLKLRLGSPDCSRSVSAIHAGGLL